MDRGAWWSPKGCKELNMTEATEHAYKHEGLIHVIMEAGKCYTIFHQQTGSPGKLVMRFQSKPEIPRSRGASGVSLLLSPRSADI